MLAALKSTPLWWRSILIRRIMSIESVSSSIMDHFERALQMFKEAASAFPESEWKIGDTDYLRPAGAAYHVVESIRFYTGNTPHDKFNWGGRFNVDWESSDSEKLPSQQELLEYLDEVCADAREWIKTNDLTQAERLFVWTGKTLLSRTAYLLRHIQHHTAEMALELTKRCYKAPEWK